MISLWTKSALGHFSIVERAAQLSNPPKLGS